MLSHYKKHQFEEYVDINSLSVPVYSIVKKNRDGKERTIFYEWDDDHESMVELFNKRTKLDKDASYLMKNKADNFKTLGIKCFPGNVLKRIFDREANKLTHFIVEIGFDYDKTPESHRWKYWKIPKGYTRRINHITNPLES